LEKERVNNLLKLTAISHKQLIGGDGGGEGIAQSSPSRYATASPMSETAPAKPSALRELPSVDQLQHQ
jgi:hypothetical protein